MIYPCTHARAVETIWGKKGKEKGKRREKGKKGKEIE
jgi:hypothetical protein